MKLMLLSLVLIIANSAHATAPLPRVEPAMKKVWCTGTLARGNRNGEDVDPGHDPSNDASIELDFSSAKTSLSMQKDFNGTPQYTFAVQAFIDLEADGGKSLRGKAQLLRKSAAGKLTAVGISDDIYFEAKGRTRLYIHSTEPLNAILSEGRPIDSLTDDAFKAGFVPAGTASWVMVDCTDATGSN